MNAPRYAILEVRELLRRASPIEEARDPVVRYLCALFAELAYHHVPQWEIDGDRRRAELIPCRAYQTLVARGVGTDVQTILQQSEVGRSFVAEDRGVIAVGPQIDDLLFIGFRGTRFLFDWRINLRSRLVPIDGRFHPYRLGGRLHSGFSEEALRISTKIADIIADRHLSDDVRGVFLSGHSLGGAVAAIAGHSLHIAPTSVCIFGAPRYGDMGSYGASGSPPTHVRRVGDVIPTVPPKWLGYVDHPYEFKTSGQPYVDSRARPLLLSDSWHWATFLGNRFRPHHIESYRAELGTAANASAAHSPLTDFARL